MSRTVATVFLLISGSRLLAQTASTPSIQGTLADANTGKPISSALITVIRNGLPPLSQNATSTSSGAFTFSNLSAATYRICIQAPTGGYLNPCTWTPKPPSVTVTAGQTASVQLKIAPGSVLSVRINDPSNVLAQIGKASQIPPVAMSVRTPTGMFEPLAMRIADSTGSEHEVTIPFDFAVPLWVHSPKLNLTQTGGAAVPPAGASLSVTHTTAAAGTPPQLAFQITGIKP